MKPTIRKLIRTVQSELYFLKSAKDAYYYYSRKCLSQTHELEWQALRFVPDDLPGCYIDVGANQGQSIESIKVMKPKARIFSFEPNQVLAHKLQKRYKTSVDITVLPYGLSDQVSVRPLFVPVYRGFMYDGEASFDEANATASFNDGTLFFFNPRSLHLRRMACETRRLDDQELDPIFIKVDCQGHEYDVIAGGTETINKYDPILMLEGFHGNEPLERLIAELGYREYVYNESGFYRGVSATAVNTLLLTPRRAESVRQATC